MPPRYGILHNTVHNHRVIIAEWNTYLAILPEYFGQAQIDSITITESSNPWGWRYLDDNYNQFFIDNLDKWESDNVLGKYPVYFYKNDMFEHM
jgi:hypothetical protein